MKLEEPDRVPIGELDYDQRLLSNATGIPVEQVFPDEGVGDLRMRKIRNRVEALSTLIEKLYMDFVPVGEVSPIGWRPRMIDENTWVDEWGAKWRYRDGIKWYVGGALKGAEDFQSLEFPDPHAPGRMDEAERLVKRFKGKRALFGGLVGQKIPHLARGLDGYTVDLYRSPRLAKRFMEVTTKYNIEIGKLLIDQGVDMICMGGDLAGKDGPLMSLNQFREVFAPAIREPTEAFHKRGVPVIKHSDGNLNPIMDDLIATGVDAVHSLEPLAGMNIAEIKAKYGDRVCLLGNIDCSHTLTLKPLRQVEREVKECINAASPGGGHILSSSNCFHAAVKLENVLAMIRAGRKYGKYPIT